MPVTKLRRLVTGRTDLDQWIDETCSAIERALNVQTAAPLVANLRPDGWSLSFAGVYVALAKSGGSGIGANSFADVTLYDLDQTGTLTSLSITAKAYNPSGTPVSASKTLVLLKYKKWWIVIFEDCT